MPPGLGEINLKRGEKKPNLGAMDDGRKDEEVVGDADVPTGSDEEIAVCSATGSVEFQPKNPPEDFFQDRSRDAEV